jgi:hypothetical protein
MSNGPKQANSTETPPTGIKVVCWFGILTALVEIVGVIALLTTGVLFWALITSLALGVEIVVIYGLWTIKPWGWLIGVIWHGLKLLSSGYQFASGDLTSFIGIVISAFLLLALSGHRDVYG